jgi:copper resistance protein D
VSALVLAGFTELSMLIGRVSDLWTSNYGRTATVKLLFVACLLGCAAFNKLRLTPRLKAGDGEAVRSLRRSIGVELVFVACILLATASLTTLTGPPALE